MLDIQMYDINYLKALYTCLERQNSLHITLHLHSDAHAKSDKLLGHKPDVVSKQFVFAGKGSVAVFP